MSKTPFVISVDFNTTPPTVRPSVAQVKKNDHDCIRWDGNKSTCKFLGVVLNCDWNDADAQIGKKHEWDYPIFSADADGNHTMTVYDQQKDNKDANGQWPIHSYYLLYTTGDGVVRVLDPGIQNEN